MYYVDHPLLKIGLHTNKQKKNAIYFRYHLQLYLECLLPTEDKALLHKCHRKFDKCTEEDVDT